MSTRSILLIEPEPSIREVLQTCLSELGGWRVTVSNIARSGDSDVGMASTRVVICSSSIGIGKPVRLKGLSSSEQDTARSDNYYHIEGDMHVYVNRLEI